MRPRLYTPTQESSSRRTSKAMTVHLHPRSACPFSHSWLVRASLAVSLSLPSHVGQRVEGVVPPFGTRSHWIRGDSTTRWITVRGGGESDLDCQLFSGGGRLLASDVDNTSYCVLAIRRQGKYLVRVENMGPRINRYVIVASTSLEGSQGWPRSTTPPSPVKDVIGSFFDRSRSGGELERPCGHSHRRPI
jgi:hypothetical protein